MVFFFFKDGCRLLQVSQISSFFFFLRFLVLHNYRVPKENLLSKTGEVTPEGKYISPYKASFDDVCMSGMRDRRIIPHPLIDICTKDFIITGTSCLDVS